MSRWDEETGCEILTPAERSQLEKEIAAFAAKKEKARAWAVKVFAAKAAALGIEPTTLPLARTVYRATFRDLEAQYFDKTTGESAQAKALCMFAPIEFLKGGTNG